MKRRTSASFLLALAAASFFTACHDQPSPTEPAAPAARPDLAAAGDGQGGGYIIVLSPLVTDPAGEARRQVAQHQGQLHFVYEHALRGYAATLPPAAVAALRANPAVRYVEPDVEVQADDTQSPTPTWGLDRIDQRDLPLNNTYTWMRIGAGVRVYILDTGIRTTHQDFGGYFPGRAIAGASFVPDGRGTTDCNGHGTAIAGTVAGSKYGVAKGATVVAVRVLGCDGAGLTSWVLAGIDWVTAHAPNHSVANLSFSTTSVSQSLNTAVTNSINAGITYTLSAGNNTRDACTVSPASVPAALTIAGATKLDARVSSSNFGSCIDLFAPGQGIITDWYTSDQATQTRSGTSIASAHVAGAAALYLEQNPLATPAQVANALKNKASVGKISNPGTGTPNRLLYMAFLSPGDLWVTRAPLPSRRSMFAVGVSGDFLYVAGGRSNGTLLRSVLTYSATTNTWSSRAQMPSVRYAGNGAAVINGVLYVPGGSDAGGNQTRTLYAYNLSTNTWSSKATLPVTSGCGASAAIAGKLYVLTGCPQSSQGKLYRYTPATNSWTALAPSPWKAAYPAVGVIGGRLYVAGGIDLYSSDPSAGRDLLVYNPATSSWSRNANMPAGVYGAAGGVINERFYVVGGNNTSTDAVASTYVYDPVTNVWTSKHPMSAARGYLGAGVIAKRLYAVGGMRDLTDLTTVERYKP